MHVFFEKGRVRPVPNTQVRVEIGGSRQHIGTGLARLCINVGDISPLAAIGVDRLKKRIESEGMGPICLWLGLVWGWDMVALEMYIASLMILIGFVFVYRQLIVCDMRLSQLIGRLNNFEEAPAIESELLLTKIEDMVMDVMGTMRNPTAIDHIGGAIAQMIQARSMQAMGVNPFGQQAELEDNVEEPRAGGV